MLRLIAKLLREIVTTQRLPEFADVKDALRRRLSALRVRYQPREFDDAFPIVASNLLLVPAQPPIAAVTPLHESPMSKQDAATVLVDLRKKLGQPIVIKGIKKPLRRTQAAIDGDKAARMVLAEIEASVARCEALEGK